MNPNIARALIVTVPWTLIGWTICCWAWDLPAEWTSSRVMMATAVRFPILAWLFGFACCGLAADAFPLAPWHWLLCLAVAFACVGHALWPL